MSKRDHLPPSHVIEEWLEQERQREIEQRPRINLPHSPKAPSAPKAPAPKGKDAPSRGVDVFPMW